MAQKLRDKISAKYFAVHCDGTLNVSWDLFDDVKIMTWIVDAGGGISAFCSRSRIILGQHFLRITHHTVLGCNHVNP